MIFIEIVRIFINKSGTNPETFKGHNRFKR